MREPGPTFRTPLCALCAAWEGGTLPSQGPQAVSRLVPGPRLLYTDASQPPGASAELLRAPRTCSAQMFNHRRFHFLIFVVEPCSLLLPVVTAALELGGLGIWKRLQWGPLAGGRGAHLSLLCPTGSWGQSPALGGRVWSGLSLGARSPGQWRLWSPQGSSPIRTGSHGPVGLVSVVGHHGVQGVSVGFGGAHVQGYFFGGTPASQHWDPGLRLAVSAPCPSPSVS